MVTIPAVSARNLGKGNCNYWKSSEALIKPIFNIGGLVQNLGGNILERGLSVLV